MNNTDLDFSSKVVLVTGGSRGLGREIALSFARRGGKVVVCGRKQENLDTAVEHFGREGLELIAHKAHVAKAEEVGSLFRDLQDGFGRLDIVVNNVGMNTLTPSIAEADEALWDKIIDVNLKGTYLVSKEAGALMRSSGGGKIINISSIAARRTAIGMGIYCVAKAGVEMLTKVMAVELAKDGISVKAVAPCMVKTKFSKPFWSNEDLLKEIVKTIPKGRIAETADVVGAVLFLASDLSNSITGEVITVHGGAMTM